MSLYARCQRCGHPSSMHYQSQVTEFGPCSICAVCYAADSSVCIASEVSDVPETASDALAGPETRKKPRLGYWITVAEAAVILGVSGRRVRALVAAGRIEAKHVNSRLLLLKRSSVKERKGERS